MVPHGVVLPGSDELFDSAACGLLVTGRDGLIRRANATFCRWVGHEADELAGKRKLQDLLTRGGQIFYQTHLAPLIQMQGSVSEVKLDIVHKLGRAIPIMLNVVVRTSVRDTYYAIAVFLAEDRHKYERELLLARKRAEDLAAQERRAQEALMQAQDELGRQRAAAEDRALFAEQMVGIVSHDLRNPLSTIQMGTHLLGQGDLTADQRAVLGRINNSTARALRLINELLDFTLTRIGHGLSLSLEPIQLHQLVSDSVHELALAFPGRQLVHRPLGDGECLADADRLVQLIGNLVANAMTYGAADKPVVVTSSISDQGFEIVVHNQGEPILPDQMGQLFEPMIRGGGKSSRGVGLGLFIVREIARAHGGAVDVTSAADLGTTFRARFPSRTELA